MSTKRTHPGIETLESPEQTVDATYPIDVIRHPEHPALAEVATLDRSAFGDRDAIPEDRLRDMVSDGGVVLLQRTPDGSIVSEAALVLEPHGSSPVSIERELPEWAGYCAGAAVDSSGQGHGLQRELLRAREALTRSAGKSAVASSVRQGNLKSIRSMLKTGYVVACDAPELYGRGLLGDRIVTLKLFDIEIVSEIPNGEAVELEVRQSDVPEAAHNAAMAKLLDDGYVGIACRDHEDSGSEDRRCVMSFAPIESWAPEHAEYVRKRIAELQRIVR
jgi:ribosomal protein S18 acetylase RimI-like enzyme